MSPQSRRNLFAIVAIVLALGTVAWAFGKVLDSRPGPAVDNGLHSTIPGPPPEAMKAMRKMMDARMASGQPLPEPPREGQPFDPERARAAMAGVLSAEEQDAMREGMKDMMAQREKIRKTLSPEDARDFESKMRVRIRQFMDQRRQQIEAEQKARNGSDPAPTPENTPAPSN